MEKVTFENFDLEILSNPRIFAINRLAAHSDHVFYKSQSECELKNNSLRKSLDGKWKFLFHKNPSTCDNGFYKEDFDDSSFSYINVPGHMQLQGYGQPIYTNQVYPFNGNEKIDITKTPYVDNYVGQYVCTFDSQDDWQNTFICFDGVDHSFALWLNGKFIGYSTDSFTPNHFDLSDYIKDGKNRLCVQVFRYSVLSYLEDQDFWRLSGIFRSVYLYTKPKFHVEDLFVKQDFNSDFSKAKITCNFKVSGKGNINYELIGIDNDVVAKGYTDKETFEISVENPYLWSAEKPNLYTLRLTLTDDTNSVVEFIEEKIGLRKFELKDRTMLINGKRIIFNGVNRHEFSARNGRSVTYDEILEDLIIMKQHNINAVRTSHYPNNSDFYRLCDRLGLYVIDETNLETHGLWQELGDMRLREHTLPNDNDAFSASVMDRGQSMLERDKNHACVIIWSCGNESFGGKILFELSEYFRNTDPSRLVHYEGIFHDRRYNATSDMESQMYTPVKDVKAFLQEHPEKPMILCEYTHSMGNSNGGMHLYTDLAKEGGLYQGGFIWDFCDQAIFTKNEDGLEYLAYGGDFKDRPTDANFAGNGIVFADRRLTPKITAVKYNYQSFDIKVSKDSFNIKNYFLFTNLNEFYVKAVLKIDGIKVKEFDLGTLNLAPQESKEYKLPETLTFEKEGEYTLCVSVHLSHDTEYAKVGHEIAFSESVIANIQKTKVKSEKKLTFIKDTVNSTVVGENFRYIFHNGKGQMVSKVNFGIEALKAPVSFNFFRAPTDNDYGYNMGYEYGLWKSAGTYTKVVEAFSKEENGKVYIRYVHKLCLPFEAYVTASYVVDADGVIDVTLSYKKVEGMSDIPEFGMLFKLYSSFDKVSYYGLGPVENYCDRTQGTKLGRYNDCVKNMYTDYLKPQECGNRTSIREFSLTDDNNTSFTIEKVNENLNVSALEYTPSELENAYHAYELPHTLTTVVKVSVAQMGVGGDDTWGSHVLPEYRVQNQDLTLNFRIK